MSFVGGPNLDISSILEGEFNDPFKKLGYGLRAFRKMLRNITFLFFVLTIMMLPSIYIYSKGKGSSNQFKKNQSNLFTFTLGNMGYDSVRCNRVPNDVGII